MKIPTMQGIIRRRLLINFHVDPLAIQKMIPAPFRPKLHRGLAIAGICLIRLEQLRPSGIPAFLGLSSENAAHRIAVTWTDANKQAHEGVYIHRRDTNSALARIAGGRIFPGRHHSANFRVIDDGHSVDFAMTSRDGEVSVQVRGNESQLLPASSCFNSLGESSRFFECGSLGYSPSHDARRLEGVHLETKLWNVRVFAISEVESSWFSELAKRFPGAAELDHALVMRDIPHKWKNAGILPPHYE